jgi:hypothetical protein
VLKSIEKKFNDFLYLNESKEPGLSAILESAIRNLESLRPGSFGSRKSRRALVMALHELKQARLESRRMDERLKTLEEQIKVLEKGK